jgi:hypothetical protein
MDFLAFSQKIYDFLVGLTPADTYTSTNLDKLDTGRIKKIIAA